MKSPSPKGDVVFGGFLRYLVTNPGHGWWQGRKLTTNCFWQVLKPPPADYVIYIPCWMRKGIVDGLDAPVTRTEDGNFIRRWCGQPGDTSLPAYLK